MLFWCLTPPKEGVGSAKYKCKLNHTIIESPQDIISKNETPSKKPRRTKKDVSIGDSPENGIINKRPFQIHVSKPEK